jgi:hypothetical protein
MQATIKNALITTVTVLVTLYVLRRVPGASSVIATLEG